MFFCSLHLNKWYLFSKARKFIIWKDCKLLCNPDHDLHPSLISFDKELNYLSHSVNCLVVSSSVSLATNIYFATLTGISENFEFKKQMKTLIWLNFHLPNSFLNKSAKTTKCCLPRFSRDGVEEMGTILKSCLIHLFFYSVHRNH